MLSLGIPGENLKLMIPFMKGTLRHARWVLSAFQFTGIKWSTSSWFWRVEGVTYKTRCLCSTLLYAGVCAQWCTYALRRSLVWLDRWWTGEDSGREPQIFKTTQIHSVHPSHQKPCLFVQILFSSLALECRLHSNFLCREKKIRGGLQPNCLLNENEWFLQEHHRWGFQAHIWQCFSWVLFSFEQSQHGKKLHPSIYFVPQGHMGSCFLDQEEWRQNSSVRTTPIRVPTIRTTSVQTTLFGWPLFRQPVWATSVRRTILTLGTVMSRKILLRTNGESQMFSGFLVPLSTADVEYTKVRGRSICTYLR